MIVAANIEAAMQRRGYNPAELARLAGTNQTGVYDILSGKSRSPRLDTIAKIAAALSVPIFALFEERSADDLREQLVAILSRLPDQERERLLLTARAWASHQPPQG